MMGDVEDPSAIFVESSRFWVQRVVVPMLVCVGVVGNVISVIILTRYELKSPKITRQSNCNYKSEFTDDE